EGRCPFKKIGGRDIKRAGNLLQAARANPVDPLFVFLDLLKRKAQGFSQFFLAHPQYDAPQADTAADMAVDGIWGFFHGPRSNRCASAPVIASRSTGYLVAPRQFIARKRPDG